jgi:hypothetical protein
MHLYACPEVEEPQTVKEMVYALMPDVLKEATEAQGLSVELKGHELSTELVSQLKKHSVFMFAMYRKLDQMVRDQLEDLNDYRPILARLDPAMTWYKLRSKTAKAMAVAVKKEMGVGKPAAKRGAGAGKGRGKGKAKAKGAAKVPVPTPA